MRDRLVVGIRDEQLSVKLQLDATLTLKKAVDQARPKKVVRKQQTVVRISPLEGATDVETGVGDKKRAKSGGHVYSRPTGERPGQKPRTSTLPKWFASHFWATQQ